MYKNIKLLNYFIYLLLLFYLVIDTITGISLKTVGISFSIPYKIFILGLMILVIGMYNQIDFTFILFIFLWLFFSIVTMILFDGHNFSLAIQTYVKVISGIIFYFYFTNLIKYESRCIYYIKKILIINGLVFAANIGAGILGFGYNTYSYGVGIKGFFYAGNEIFLILLSITTLLIQNKDKKIRIIIGSISLIFSVLIGTKTAMLALLIILFVNGFSNLKKKTQVFFIFLIPFFILLFVVIFRVVLSKIPVFEHIIYNIGRNKDLTGSIVSALLSGRVDFLKNNLTLLKEQTDFLHFIFGGNAYYNNKNVEIDFFDVLILNGSIMAILVLFFYLGILYKSIKQKNKILITMNLTIIGISFTAGHVWSNLTGGLFFIMANLFFNIFTTHKFNRRIIHV